MKLNIFLIAVAIIGIGCTDQPGKQVNTETDSTQVAENLNSTIEVDSDIETENELDQVHGSNEQPDKEWVTYQNQEYGFSLQHPKKYQVSNKDVFGALTEISLTAKKGTPITLEIVDYEKSPEERNALVHAPMITKKILEQQANDQSDEIPTEVIFDVSSKEFFIQTVFYIDNNQIKIFKQLNVSASEAELEDSEWIENQTTELQEKTKVDSALLIDIQMFEQLVSSIES
ncbi:MAG: hypothetical protein Q8P90_02385 [bacterium]|nr:hypothetical protein [bacterium]